MSKSRSKKLRRTFRTGKMATNLRLLPRLLSLIAALLTVAAIGVSAEARPLTTTGRMPVNEMPSWFPKVPCAEAWGGKDLARYDHKTDIEIKDGVGNVGYSKYQNRLKAKGIDRKSCYKDWAVLVFMSADNDLSPYAMWDLHEMEGPWLREAPMSGSTLRSDLLVQLDSEGATGIRRVHVFQRPGTNYRVPLSKDEFTSLSPAQGIKSPIVQYFDEPAGGQKEYKKRFREFLEWGVREYPARHYFVITWGHGKGWTTADERNLTTADLADVLDDTTKITLENTRPIDIVAADSCLMQTIEVANEVSSSARYVIGSAQVQTFLGLPYRQLMYQINSGYFLKAQGTVNSKDEPYLVARTIPTLVEKAVDPKRGAHRADPKAIETFTISSLSSAAVKQQLVPSLNRLGKALQDYSKDHFMNMADLTQIIDETQGFQGGAKEVGVFVGKLQVMLQRVINEKGQLTPAGEKLRKACDDVKSALSQASLSYALGTNYKTELLPILGFKSVGIWIPRSQDEFQFGIDSFGSSKLYKGSDWEKWVRALYEF